MELTEIIGKYIRVHDVLVMTKKGALLIPEGQAMGGGEGRRWDTAIHDLSKNLALETTPQNYLHNSIKGNAK